MRAAVHPTKPIHVRDVCQLRMTSLSTSSSFVGIGMMLSVCVVSGQGQSPPLEFNILEFGLCKEGGVVLCTRAITAAVAAARAAVVSRKTIEADVVVPKGKVCGSSS